MAVSPLSPPSKRSVLSPKSARATPETSSSKSKNGFVLYLMRIIFCLTSRPPHRTQIKDEARQLRITADRLRIVEHLRRLAGTIDMDLSLFRIDQPAELAAVGDVLVHLFLQLLE